MSETTSVDAKLSRAVWKPVLCASCGCGFLYRMRVSAQAEIEVGILGSADNARDSAERLASAELRKKMLNGCRPVPCPQCGNYQPNMVAAIRAHLWSRIAAAAQMAGIVAALLAAGWAMWWEGGNPADVLMYLFRMPTVWCAAGVGVVAAGAAVYAYFLLDPNADAAARAGMTKFTADGPFLRDKFEAMREQFAAAGRPLDPCVPPMSMVFGLRPEPAEPPGGAGDIPG